MKSGTCVAFAVFLSFLMSFFNNCALATTPDNIVFPPDSIHVMPVSRGNPMMHPCSRDAPKAVTKFWEPTSTEVEKLETQLVIYMQSLQAAGSLRPPAGSYGRQYIGIVVRGKRFIYGNFFPSSVNKGQQASWPVSVCDGGPSLWSIVYDPALNTFADLKFTSTL